MDKNFSIKALRKRDRDEEMQLTLTVRSVLALWRAIIILFAAAFLLAFTALILWTKYNSLSDGQSKTNDEVISSRQSNYEGRGVVCQNLIDHGTKPDKLPPGCLRPEILPFYSMTPSNH